MENVSFKMCALKYLPFQQITLKMFSPCFPYISHFKIKSKKVTLKYIVAIFRKIEYTNICTTQITTHAKNLQFFFKFFGF